MGQQWGEQPQPERKPAPEVSAYAVAEILFRICAFGYKEFAQLLGRKQKQQY